MKTQTIECIVDCPLEEYEDKTMVLKIEFIPGYPAKISGPPEDCYPGEAPEITNVNGAWEEDGSEISEKILAKLDDDWLHEILDEELNKENPNG